jgi:siroheme synthase (precorrin-2 oxidase/ferrochelatase)
MVHLSGCSAVSCHLTVYTKFRTPSVQEWQRLQSIAMPSLKELLLSDQARTDMVVAPRGQAKWRRVESML